MPLRQEKLAGFQYAFQLAHHIHDLYMTEQLLTEVKPDCCNKLI